MTRISPGTIIIGVFAVLFGLIGAYAVRQHLAPKPEPQAQEEPAAPPLRTVPMASTDVEAGRPLTLGDIAILRMTDKQVAEMKLPPNYMTNPQQIIGRVLRQPLTQGEVFLTTQMYPENMLPTVAQRLTSGLRAVTVPMQDNGLAAPGSVIDVIFRSSGDAERQRPQATVTLLEGVEILAVGHNEVPGRRGEPDSPTTVTLAVTAEQANALKVVEGHGEFHVAMRSPDDIQVSREVRPQTLDGLLGFSPRTAYATEIYRGTAKTTNSFVEPEANPLAMTRFPIGPNRVVSRSDSESEATSPTSFRKDGSEPAAEEPTSPTQPANAIKPVKRGLSGLPLLPDANKQKELDLARFEAAGAE